MTALELINIALTRMNESTLSSLTLDTYVARLCRSMIKPVMDEVTMQEDWQFARKRAELVEDEVTDNLSDFEYIYDMPADCLVPRSLRSGLQYEIEDWKMYTDDDEPVLIYTREMVLMVEDVESDLDLPVLQTAFPITFAQAVACRLGSQIGPKISDNFNLATALAGEYVAMLEQTKNFDAMLTPGVDEDQILWDEVG